MEITWLTLALPVVVTIATLIIKEIPGWYMARGVQQIARQTTADQVTSETMKRLNAEIVSQAERARVERDERRKEYELMTAQLYQARKLLVEMQGELDAVRSSGSANLGALTKEVADLKLIIVELQTKLDQEQQWRLAAEKRVAELELQVKQLLEQLATKGKS